MTTGLSYDPNVPYVRHGHSQPRYPRGMQATYLNHSAGFYLAGFLALKAAVSQVRKTDYEAAHRVDHFIANPQFMAERSQKSYGNPASVIHPPVNWGDYDHDQQG